MFYEVISEEDSLILFVVVFSLSCELRIGNILSLQIFMYLIFYNFFLFIDGLQAIMCLSV